MGELEFIDYLRQNTRLMESTILLYDRTIRRYNSQDTDLNKDRINNFIAKGFRDTRSYYVKYCFRHYLSFIKKPHLYKQLVSVKTRPRKKMGKYVSAEKLTELITAIKDETYRDLAALQYATGARAREIIALKEENTDFEFSQEAIRLRLEGKGGKERITFLSQDYAPILKKYMRGRAGYYFLPDGYQYVDTNILEKAINNKRSYYYTNLQRAARSCGLDGFGTHDFRRNVAEQLKNTYKDIMLVKKVLGHSNITTTIRYFDESPQDVQAAVLNHQRKGGVR